MGGVGLADRLCIGYKGLCMALDYVVRYLPFIYTWQEVGVTS